MKKFINFRDLKTEFETRPKSKFLWSGIKEKSFGLVFGPSKSGKTIFCENLAIQLATGGNEFFGKPLEGKPKKILFLGLEEFWVSRMERNLKQVDSLDNEKMNLIEENYLFQPIDFERQILTKKNWENLEESIVSSEAEVVFIDSITRMNPGKIENSETAEFIMQNLRKIAYENEVTLICIHHTPKMHDSAITIDKIKGSSVFAQESDFAIGINRTSKGHRYMKEVFYRYASDDFDYIDEFKINQNTTIEKLRSCSEDSILSMTDRRIGENRGLVEKVLNDNANTTYKTEELVYLLKEKLDIRDRQAKTYLSELVKENRIVQPKRGYYSSKLNKKNDNEDENSLQSSK